jgi:hypothetical protein
MLKTSFKELDQKSSRLATALRLGLLCVLMTVAAFITPLTVFFVVLGFLTVAFLCTAETFLCLTERTLHFVYPF